MSSQESRQEHSNATDNRLPLTEMRYTGDVHGITAQMQLELRYKNLLETPIESVFTFPMLPETSVSEVEILIGDNKVQSQLRERDKARQIYDEARDQGHHATLLEEETPSIFTMSVGGIEPGQEVSVRIKYLNRVDWQDGGGRLAIPLVVAPHFVDVSRSSQLRPINPPVATDPSAITYKASIRMNLQPGFDARVCSPSHDILFTGRDCSRSDSLVIDIDNIATDRDLVFTYQSKERNPVASLAIEQRETALNADEKFYLVQLTPPSLESSLRPEREIVLCLDTSGSMEGLALDGLKRAVSKILERLGADNGKVSVGVLGFNDSQKILSPLMPLTEVEPLLKSIQGLCAGGGTQAGAAIEAALTMFGPRGERQVERSIVFITDGDSSAYEYRNTGRADVRIHGVGISSAIDHHVLKAVCERTGGSTYWVHPGEDYDVVAREVVSRTNGPIVKDVSVEGLNPTVQVIGGRELWNGEVQTLVFRDSAPIPESIVVRGTYMNGNTFTQTIECSDSVDTRLAVSKVWTREQLRGDISPAVGTQLSLEYGVLSRWTSFVAVQEKAVPGAQPERVDIPVHMPHGWEMEVGGIRGSFLSASGPMMLEAACGDAAVYSLCADSLDCDSGMFFGSFADFGLIEEDVGQADAAIHPTEPLLLSEVNRFLAGIQQAPFSQDFSEKWKEILTTLEAQAELGFADWSEAQKAELYLALGTARGYGFTTAIPQELRERPRTDAAAVEHWRAAQRALGIHPQP